MNHLKISRKVKSPANICWSVISEIEEYAKYAPNILTSKIISGHGVGMIRECSAKEGVWQEVCTSWNDKNFYIFQVNTHAETYPYPFSILNARWAVESDKLDSSYIFLDIEVEFKKPFIGWLLFPILKIKYQNICNVLMNNWEQECIRRKNEPSLTQIDP